MAVLTIATADLRRLIGLDSTDTSQDTALAAQTTAEQLPLEYALDAATLAAATGSLKALLTLGVSEQIAGSYLQQQARAPILLGTLTLGALILVPPNSATLMRLGDALALKGTVRLAAYTTAAVANAATVTATAAAKLTKLQADAANAAALDAAKLAIAQGQAAKFEIEDTADNGALIASGDVGSAFDCEAQQ